MTPCTILNRCVSLLPARTRKLLNLGWSPSRPFGWRGLCWPIGLNPLQNFMLVPAEPPAVRQLEWPWDQVGVLTIGRARADCVCCLSEQRRQLLDEKYFGQLAFCSYQRCFEHLSLFTGCQRRGRRSHALCARHLGSVKVMPRRWRGVPDRAGSERIVGSGGMLDTNFRAQGLDDPVVSRSPYAQNHNQYCCDRAQNPKSQCVLQEMRINQRRRTAIEKP